MATMTLNVYKNEYATRVLWFIIEDSRFEIIEETSKIYCIQGEEEDLEKLMQCEYCLAEDAKKIFPEIKTQEEVDKMASDIRKELFSNVQDSLIKILNLKPGECNQDLRMLYKIWEMMR